MNENQPTPPSREYRCPGERQSISRSVHLGRLAAFFPPCRDCPHREDTGSLSPRQVEQLAETAAQRRPRPLFHNEGAGGVFLDDLTPADARRIAAAFGVMVLCEKKERKGEGRGERESENHEEPSIHPSSFIPHPSTLIPPSSESLPHRVDAAAKLSALPIVVLAGDGRPISAELVAGAAD
jgi:hypothetical protein